MRAIVTISVQIIIPAFSAQRGRLLLLSFGWSHDLTEPGMAGWGAALQS